MAVALLGKCVGLLGVLILLYTSCSGFRIRHGGQQAVASTEQQSQRTTTCGPFGKCSEKTMTSTSTTSIPWRRHESTVLRATSRKPPVDPLTSDLATSIEGIRSRDKFSGPSVKIRRSENIEGVDDDDSDGDRDDEDDNDDDDDDDDDEVDVEVLEEEPDSDENDVRVSSEPLDSEAHDESEVAADSAGDESDEDEESEDEIEKSKSEPSTIRRREVKRIGDEREGGEENEDDNEDKSEMTTRQQLKKGTENVKVGLKTDVVGTNRITTSSKAIKYRRDEGEDEKREEEDEDDEDDDSKKDEEQKKPVKKVVLKKELTKSTEYSTPVKKSEKVEIKKDVAGDDKADENDKNGDDDDDSDDDEDDDDSDEEVPPTPPPTPPRKFEKVRYADKEKVRSMEVLATKPSAKETKDGIQKEKPESKKVKEEAVKQKDELPEPKDVKELDEGAKKLESKTIGSTPGQQKSLESLQAKLKSVAKPEVGKSNAKIKEKVKDVEKGKISKEGSKATPKVSTKTPREEKKDSKPKSRKHAEASITLAELNDALLHVPTFVPNFTAVQDPNCQQHGKIFLRQLRGRKLWALQMVDASAKIPSGLLRGNVNQLGDFDQCLEVMAHVKVDDKTIKVQGKYCLATVDLYATEPNMRVPVNLMQARAFIRGTMHNPGHFIPKFTTVNWALCLPAVCSAKDAESTLESALSQYNATSGIRFAVEVNPDMCYVQQRSTSYSKETIGVLYFYAMIICLVVVATARDFLVITEGKGNYSERIIMSFSLRRTVKSLIKHEASSAGNIMCIHGIRALATMLLYIAHQMVPISGIPFANRVSLTEITNNPFTSVLRTSLVYTDSFLLLSGVLTAYNMANELKTRGEIRWFCRFIARFIRLTPALLVLIFWYAFVMEHVGTGPQWNNVIVANADLCKKNAWTNLLYVQNFFPFEEMCATHTHQLALDMQLSLIAPMLVFFLQFKPIIGIILIFFLIQVSATLRYLATMNNYLSLVIFHGMSIKHLYKTANLTYALPLHRATPYVCGVTLGVLLDYTGKNVKIHKVFVILGWLIAMALGSWSLFSPWRLARRDYVYDAEEATSYAVISPVLWALALCWTIFACFTDHGGIVNKFLSNYWLVILSKISYAVYLTQFAVFFYNVGTTRYTSQFQLLRAVDPLEVITVLCVSIVLTLLFDIPMQEVKSVIMESTDHATSIKLEIKKEMEAEQKEMVEESGKMRNENANVLAEDEEEVASTGWDWQKDIGSGGSKPKEEGTDDDEPISIPAFRRSENRRRSFISHEGHEPEEVPAWDWIKGPNKRYSKDEEDYMERAGRRSRSSQRPRHDSEEEELLKAHQEREEELRRNRRSLSRTTDTRRTFNRDSGDSEESSKRAENSNSLRQRRSESRGRERDSRESEDHRTWEFVGKARSTSKEPSNKKYSDKPEVQELPVRQPAALLSKSIDTRRTLSSESEEDPHTQRKPISESGQSSEEPRVVSDEEGWEEELRMRRKQYMEKVASEQQEIPQEEDEELTSLTRRSSAEGRIALLKDVTNNGNMDAWTVSVGAAISQLGSSQEPSEPEEEGGGRERREYRENAPPSRDDTFSGDDETDSRRRSFTSEPLSADDEEEDVSAFNFVLTRGSKRISLQDLSKMAADDTDLAEGGWNLVKKDGGETLQKGGGQSGLYKREMIVKSQASEEDPEYFVPERPKLVQQEREHPFKKAWQVQKSRSEEDSSAYAIKESNHPPSEQKKMEEEHLLPKRKPSGEESEDIGCLADDETDSSTIWQARTSDTEGNRPDSKSGTDETDSTSFGRTRSNEDTEDIEPGSKSETDEECLRSQWSNEEEQEDVYRIGQSRQSKEANWDWGQEET